MAAAKKKTVAEAAAYTREVEGVTYYYQGGHGSRVYTPEELREEFPYGKLAVQRAGKAEPRLFIFTPRMEEAQELIWAMRNKVVKMPDGKYVPFTVAFGRELPAVDPRADHYYEVIDG